MGCGEGLIPSLGLPCINSSKDVLVPAVKLQAGRLPFCLGRFKSLRATIPQKYLLLWQEIWVRISGSELTLLWDRDAAMAVLVGDVYACVTCGGVGEIVNLEKEHINYMHSIDR